MITGNCHCGQSSFEYDATPKSATSCNCTICRRYGALWAYVHWGRDIKLTGETRAYVRNESGNLEFRFCEICGCLTHYVAVAKDDKDRLLVAVNLRMAPPGITADIPMRRFDGHDTWSDLPNEDRKMSDIW